ncbi:MAG: hypothetical protein V3T83_01370 [Acidobacteriota bacterium]
MKIQDCICLPGPGGVRGPPPLRAQRRAAPLIWPQLQLEGSVYYFTSPDGAVHRIAYNPAHGAWVSDDSTNIRVSGKKVEFLSGETFDFASYDSLREVYHLGRQRLGKDGRQVPAQTGQASGYGVTKTNRGNLTTVRVYDALNDRFLESETHYDTLGNPVEQADVLNRQTLIAYSSAFHFAYPTQVTNPLGHTAQTGYNFNTGLPVSWTDANGQLTTQTYEAYNRPLKATFADGGWADWACWDQYNSVVGMGSHRATEAQRAESFFLILLCALCTSVAYSAASWP